MIKRIAVAAGIAALAGTSLLACSQGVSTPQHARAEQVVPVAAGIQRDVGDVLGVAGGAGDTATSAAVATSSTVVSTSTQTTQPGCSSDCGEDDESADVEAKRAGEGGDYTAALAACVPALADQLVGYSLTGEQAGDLSYLASLSLVAELRMGTLAGYLDGSIPRDMLVDPADHPTLGTYC